MGLILRLEKSELLKEIISFVNSNNDYEDCFGPTPVGGEAHPGINMQFYYEVESSKEIDLNDKRILYILNFNKGVNGNKITLE